MIQQLVINFVFIDLFLLSIYLSIYIYIYIHVAHLQHLESLFANEQHNILIRVYISAILYTQQLVPTYYKPNSILFGYVSTSLLFFVLSFHPWRRRRMIKSIYPYHSELFFHHPHTVYM